VGYGESSGSQERAGLIELDISLRPFVGKGDIEKYPAIENRVSRGV